MKTSKSILILLAILSFGFFACEDDNEPSTEIPETMTLHAIGVATAQPGKTFIPGIDLEVEGNTFIMDFFDKNTGKKIGTATDINVAAETFDDGSMKGENYTIFTFDEDHSTLILHNFIDMTPIDPTTLKAIIPEEHTSYNLIGGTGRFAGISGGSTLDALLDMTDFAVGTVGFDCTYGIKTGN